jgi:hypothetical protein
MGILRIDPPTYLFVSLATTVAPHLFVWSRRVGLRGRREAMDLSHPI